MTDEPRDDVPVPADANEPRPTETPPAPEPAATGAPAVTPPDDAPERPAEKHVAPAPRGFWGAIAEKPEEPIDVPQSALAAQSRRAFLVFGAGTLAAVAGAWWLLPDRTKARLAPGPWRDRLDTLAARVGLSRDSREKTLNSALTFDDDVAEALYSKNRRVRTYRKSEQTRLPNNYAGRTPTGEYLPGWRLAVSGLASGRDESLAIGDLLGRFPHVDEVTRLVCVEGWSAVAWWGGFRFADFLDAFPPAPGMRWAAMRSEVNLSAAGRPDPSYVSIDLETARHPQTLLATHLRGQPLPLAHGAPLRLIAPMKLGLKNIKGITDIEYTPTEPPDYWQLRGYSAYDGL